MATLREEWREVPPLAKAVFVCGAALIAVGLVLGYAVGRTPGLVTLALGGIMLGVGNVYYGWVWRRNRRRATSQQ